MQSKQELEKWYEEPDKWGYFSNEYDALRLQKILFVLGWGKKRYDRVLDIGCGEGFMTLVTLSERCVVCPGYVSIKRLSIRSLINN